MNEQIKKQWLRALRNGKYKQTRSNLRTSTGFCCLGVLCDLYAKETNVEWEQVELDGVKKNSIYYRMHNAHDVLPLEVSLWAGVPISPAVQAAPFGDTREISQTLGNLNDTGFSFYKIAKLIEKQL